jgi:hypothetical protein
MYGGSLPQQQTLKAEKKARCHHLEQYLDFSVPLRIRAQRGIQVRVSIDGLVAVDL